MPPACSAVMATHRRRWGLWVVVPLVTLAVIAFLGIRFRHGSLRVEPCRASEMRFRPPSTDVASGKLVVIVGFTNAASQACSLTEFPMVQLLDNGNHVLPADIRTIETQRIVAVGPRAEARLDLSWSKFVEGQCNASSVMGPARLRVTFRGSGNPFVVSLSTDVSQVERCGPSVVEDALFVV